MAFLPKPGEKIEEDESVSDLYELTGSEDDRLRQAYKVKKTIWDYVGYLFLVQKSANHHVLLNSFKHFSTPKINTPRTVRVVLPSEIWSIYLLAQNR